MPKTTLPTVTGYVDQNWFLEPLGGAEHPRSYLERSFSPQVYNIGPESYLTKFMYVLLGPSGVGFLRQNALEARLALEELGLELFDLDAFYGAPLRFTRATQELYDEDPRGLIDREAWDRIRAKDAQYRSRVLDFLSAARAGSTPLGIAYAARSGLGHEVSIIENYKYLFDQYSDDPLGLDYWGKTRFTEEFVVLPRREVARSEVQVITISGAPTGGTFALVFNGETTAGIAWNAPAVNVQAFLESLPSIRVGDVEVTGDVFNYRVRFMGSWSARDVPQISGVSSLTGGSGVTISSTTEQSGVDAADEVAYISSQDQYHLQEAIDRLRPVPTIPTVGAAPGMRQRTLYSAVVATSEYDEVVRYVTGSGEVAWPDRDSVSWIEPGVEHAAPKAVNDRQYQYSGFHNVQGVETSSNHIGPFSEFQRAVFPFMNDVNPVQHVADMVLADYAEPLTIRNIVQDGDATVAQLINGMYPTNYAGLPGVPQIKYDYEQFWASAEKESGDDTLVIDLGRVQVINYIQFEVTQKPIDIAIEFDALDQDDRLWVPTKLGSGRNSNLRLTFVPENLNPWLFSEYNFTTTHSDLIYTRYLRLTFSRRNDAFSPFAINGGEDGFHPWSIEVRNLRVGRNVTNLV